MVKSRSRKNNSRSKRFRKNNLLKYTIGGIPKIIHQIWIGNTLPPIIKLYTSTFKNIPGYYYKLWGNDDLNSHNFPLTWKYISKLLKSEKIIWAKIADLMRLEILYHFGGVYVDTTMEYIKNLDKVINNTSKFIMSNESDCGLQCRGNRGKLFISNSFIASVPEYKVLKRLLSEEYLSNIDFSVPANIATGPYYVRTGIKRKSDVKMLPRKYIYAFSYDLHDYDKCISYDEQPGFIKTKYFNQVWYIKYPCDSFKDAVMIKHWDIGGTWRK